jgi:cyclic pyranopterin phosphate synthase
VRLTCTGTLYMCLGQNDSVDLRRVLRGSDGDEAIDRAIEAAIDKKPKGHDFVIDRSGSAPSILRHMSTTGG